MSLKGPVAKRRKVVSEEEFVQLLPALPDEVLVEILKRLPLGNQLEMERICKHWKKDVVAESLRSVKSLEISVSSGCKFGTRELALLSTKCPKLKNLVLSAGYECFYVDPTVLERLGTELNQLERLSIFDYRWNDAAEQNLSLSVGLMPHLKELSVGGKLSGTFLHQLPDSVISVNLDIRSVLKLSNLSGFIRSHTGLKKFRLSVWQSWSGNFDRKCQETIQLLAQHCSQLEQLTFSQTRSLGPREPFPGDRSFTYAFESLTQLKKVKFYQIQSFNTAAFESLCANCPLLEDLDISVCHPKDFRPEAIVQVDQPKKLKRLTLHLPYGNNDCQLDAWLSSIGTMLEYLDISAGQLTDASLLQISLKCSRLAHLRISYYHISTAGLQGLIDAIVNQESWDDPLKTRRLRIDVRWCSKDWLTRINLEGYGGRVEINKI